MSAPIVRTTCPYCGVGCGISARRTGPRDLAIAGDKAHPANKGKLCSKGSMLGETIGLDRRLLHPMKHGARIDWGTALDETAAAFAATIREHGPDSVAFYVSGQLLTEDYYVANKLMKGFIGSGNIDTNSRLCMSSAVAGHKRAFGEDVVPGCYEDFELADLVVLVGSNTAWCHPILYQRLLTARQQRGTRIVVVDPRKTATCDDADLHLPIAPGADHRLFNALFVELAARGAADSAFVERNTEGLDAALVAARRHHVSVAASAEACGIDESDFETFIRWFAETERTLTVFSQGINQSATGVDQVNAIVNCHLITGRLGRPGMGPFSITGQPNAMGGREVGGLANQLAAHLDFSETERDLVGRFWNTANLARSPGLKAVDLFEAVEDGRVKALWIMATNPVVSLPNANLVRAALQKCDFVALSDCVAETDTSAYADILFPATAWGEKDGTVTNSERRISRQRPLFPAPADARPDWWIVTEVAWRMGFRSAFPYRSPSEIFREHAALSAFENEGARIFDIGALAELSADGYDAMEPVQWPCPAGQGGGVARLFTDGLFPTGTGRAHFVTSSLQDTLPQDPSFPLVLNSGRLRDQWHTMTRTGLSVTLSSNAPEPVAEIHPDDAAAARIADGDLMRIVTQQASGVYRARVTGDQRRSSLFAPIHWSGMNSASAAVGSLVHSDRDPLSGQPAFKHTPARAEHVEPFWRGFYLSRREADMRAFGYWASRKIEGGYLYEIAGLSKREPAPDLAVLAVAAPGGDHLEFRDARHGSLREARLEADRLMDCLVLTRDGALPSRDWLSGLLALDAVDEATRRFLLAGRAAEGGQGEGRIVCACMGVRSTAIADAICSGAHDVFAVGEKTGAGTNCGSCRSEIRNLIAATEREDAA
ncbi:MAG: molybdopterin-dependent oxidoreductase [Parvibaculum sp.]